MRKNHDTLIGTGSVTQEGHVLARVLYAIDLWTVTGMPQGLGNAISEVYFQVAARGSLFVLGGPGLPEGERCMLYLEDETEADVMCEHVGEPGSGAYTAHFLAPRQLL